MDDMSKMVKTEIILNSLKGELYPLVCDYVHKTYYESLNPTYRDFVKEMELEERCTLEEVRYSDINLWDEVISEYLRGVLQGTYVGRDEMLEYAVV